MQAAAASNLKPVSLELGGKSPLVIFDDADVEQAADLALFGCLANKVFHESHLIYPHSLKKKVISSKTNTILFCTG